MGTSIKRFFIILIIVMSPLGNGDITSEEIRTKGLSKIGEQNHIFMIQYFEGDTAKVTRYIEEIECDSLREMVLVSLSKQELYVLEFDDQFNVKFQTLVSTGLVNKWTPTGEYKIIYKTDSCRSIKFGGIMYKWNCIHKEGIKMGSRGIHGLLHNKDYEKYLGKPKSHGCIRISNSVADSFYHITRVGMKVVII